MLHIRIGMWNQFAFCIRNKAMRWTLISNSKLCLLIVGISWNISLWWSSLLEISICRKPWEMSKRSLYLNMNPTTTRINHFFTMDERINRLFMNFQRKSNKKGKYVKPKGLQDSLLQCVHNSRSRVRGQDPRTACECNGWTPLEASFGIPCDTIFFAFLFGVRSVLGNFVHLQLRRW